MDSSRLQKKSKRGKAALVIGIAAAGAVVLALVFAVVSITPDRAAIMGILGPPVIAVFAAGAFLVLRLVKKMEYDSFDAGMYLVMESVPTVCSLYDMENNLIYCNDKTHKLFGFKDRKEYAGNYPSSFPEFQPGGSSSDDMAIAFINKAIKDGSATLLWYQKASNGELIPLQLTGVRAYFQGGLHHMLEFTRDKREELEVERKREETEKERMRAALHTQEKEYYQAQCEMMQESVRQVKAIRHDMKAHIATMRGYAETYGVAPIIEHCDALLGGMEETELYSDTGNIAFDSIINYKLKNARAHNIKAEVRMNVPQALNVELSDTAVILGNLLDNALDAVAKVEDRQMLLDIEYSREVLYVKAKNTFDGAVEYAPAESAGKRAAAGSGAPANRLPVSRKAGREHGYGLGNVKRAVDKYRGHMTVVHEGNEFTVTLMLLCG